MGNYAVQPTFSDGHNTGIFSWDYLYFLGSQQAELWQRVRSAAAAAGMSRDAPMAAAGRRLGPAEPLALNRLKRPHERHPFRLQDRRRNPEGAARARRVRFGRVASTT